MHVWISFPPCRIRKYLDPTLACFNATHRRDERWGKSETSEKQGWIKVHPLTALIYIETLCSIQCERDLSVNCCFNLFCWRIWSYDANNKKQSLNYVKRQMLSLPTGRPLSCFCHHLRIPEQPKQISWLAQFKRKIECLLCHRSSSLFRFIDRERSTGGFHLANRLCLLKESAVGVDGGRECLFDLAPVWNHFAPLPSVHILSATTRTACPLHRWSPSWSLGKWVMWSGEWSAGIIQSRLRVWLGSPVLPTSVFISSGNCVSKSGGKQQSSGGAPVNMLMPKCEKIKAILGDFHHAFGQTCSI